MSSVLFGSLAAGAAEGATATGLIGTTTMTAAGTATTAFSAGQTLMTAGALAGGVGILASGMQQAEMADAQADYAEGMGRYNAALIEQQADHDKRVAAEGFRREQARRRVAMGKSGVSGGSAVEVLAGAAARNELDLLDMEHSAAMRARQAKYGSGHTASTYRASGRQSRITAPVAAGGSLLANGARIFRGVGG